MNFRPKVFREERENDKKKTLKNLFVFLNSGGIKEMGRDLLLEIDHRVVL